MITLQVSRDVFELRYEIGRVDILGLERAECFDVLLARVGREQPLELAINQRPRFDLFICVGDFRY